MADIDRNALAALIEAVEDNSVNWYGWEDREDALPNGLWEVARAADMGSLDAAKALHEALLPGWHWTVSHSRSGGGASVWHEPDKCRAAFTASDPSPARALLLAILRALAAEGGE